MSASCGLGLTVARIAAAAPAVPSRASDANPAESSEIHLNLRLILALNQLTVLLQFKFNLVARLGLRSVYDSCISTSRFRLTPTTITHLFDGALSFLFLNVDWTRSSNVWVVRMSVVPASTESAARGADLGTETVKSAC